MNVWIIHHYAMPPFLSGITKHFMLAKELEKQGHSPTIIAANLNHKNKDTIIPKGKNYLYEIYDNIPFLWLKTISSSEGYIKRVVNMFIFFWRLMLRTGFNKLQKPDVIIGCSPEPFAALAALLIAKRYKVPYILHMGDLWPLSLIDIGSISKYHPFIILVGMIEKYLYKNADRIITPLPTIKNHVARNGGNPDNIVWLPNGVDIDKLPKYKKPELSKKFKIYYAGAHGPANSLDAILNAAKIIQGTNSNIEFIFIGDGTDKAGLQERAVNENITNLKFFEPLPKDKIYAELQQANAFIMNFKDLNVLREGGVSPNKLYDYMGVGRPTIIGCSAPTNPIKLANAGITVAANDAKAIANAVLKLEKMSDDECEQLGKNGYNSILKNNSYTQIGKTLENVLVDVLSGQPTNRQPTKNSKVNT